MATVFFYARLWRRSGVMTDLEFYEIRYSGKAARRRARVPGASISGCLFNCMIMATVNLAACKIAGDPLRPRRAGRRCCSSACSTSSFATHSGLWGVLVIDMIQFFIKMTAVIAAAYFALQAPQVGGLSGMVTQALGACPGPNGINYLNILPDFTNNWDIAVAVFVMPIAVQWWAVWYPGAEPGGGSYIAQRMLASKSEKDALGAVLFFNVAHYVLRPWPWILVGALLDHRLPAALGHPEGVSRTSTRALIGHDIAYPGDAEVPAGRLHRADGGRADRRQLLDDPHAPELGRVVSGARLLPPLHQEGRDRAALRAGGRAWRRCSCSSARRRWSSSSTRRRTRSTSSCRSARARAAVPGALVLVARERVVRGRRDGQLVRRVAGVARAREERACTSARMSALLLTIAFTTVCWVRHGLRRPRNRSQTCSWTSTSKVAPAGPGLGAGPRREPARGRRHATGAVDNIPLALLGWVSGCTLIWSALFTRRQLPLRAHRHRVAAARASPS